MHATTLVELPSAISPQQAWIYAFAQELMSERRAERSYREWMEIRRLEANLDMMYDQYKKGVTSE